jgi:hypothetical protein
MNNMQYRMYDTKGNHIMNLSYRPSPLDLIRNDETGLFYNIVSINSEKQFCVARRNFSMEE